MKEKNAQLQDVEAPLPGRLRGSARLCPRYDAWAIFFSQSVLQLLCGARVGVAGRLCGTPDAPWLLSPRPAGSPLVGELTADEQKLFDVLLAKKGPVAAAAPVTPSLKTAK